MVATFRNPVGGKREYGGNVRVSVEASGVEARSREIAMTDWGMRRGWSRWLAAAALGVCVSVSWCAGLPVSAGGEPAGVDAQPVRAVVHASAGVVGTQPVGTVSAQPSVASWSEASPSTGSSSAGLSDVFDDVLLQAMTDELARSMERLSLPALARPYFIQYVAEDSRSFNLTARLGALVRDDRSRRRLLRSRVRVGSYAMDNTNLGWGGLGGANLPLDDDYGVSRQAIWLATDRDYKSAVQVLARKEAALKQLKIEDRPDDFSAAPAVRVIDPLIQLAVDRDAWRANTARLSARFARYPQVETSQVTFFAGDSNRYLVNSEGTRYRHGDTGVLLSVEATMRAPDGMALSDGLTYVGEAFDQIPSVDRMLTDIDGLCENLTALSKAGMIEHYLGPVLFEPEAAARVFDAMLSDALCAKPVTFGSRWGQEDTMEKKIGVRILPRSFNVFDDPSQQFYEGQILAGWRSYDDEAVRAQRVDLVENGVLKTLLSCRAPSRKIKTSNGHGQGRFTDASAHIACLFIDPGEGMSDDALRKALIEAGRDEGLAYCLRIASIEEGGAGSLGDPIMVYKVYVSDGHEELVRGLEFLPVEIRALRDIVGAGKRRAVYNNVGGQSGSVIAPGILFREFELTKVEPQFDRLPILKPPALRDASGKPAEPRDGADKPTASRGAADRPTPRQPDPAEKTP